MQGRSAWLITWEGSEAEHNGRCKVVAIVPANYGDDSIILSLRILYHSECTLTLGQKAVPRRSIHKDTYFRKAYRDINSEYWYGEFPKHYLSARKVKNLRCEDSKKDDLESTLRWTELPRFVPNPEIDFNGPLPADPAMWIRQVRRERDAHYTYSIRQNVEEEKARKAELDRLRRESR